ncbi:MAG: ABC transporter substrate-binding protein [Chloroflexota bacterium]
MRFLIGVDDTDNLESRGTGYHARTLGEILLATGGLARGITRHQLLVDPRIPYTSHNSSACLDVDAAECDFDAILTECRRFLQTASAPGSDAGLCLARWSAVTDAAQEFGRAAKRVVLTTQHAFDIAKQIDATLEGLTGTGGGVIGALAGVGLRASGNDGRFLWTKGIREVSGVWTAAELCAQTGIEEIQTLEGACVHTRARIALSEWVRPLLREGKAILIVEEEKGHDDYEWRVAAKEIVKQHSN